MVNAVRRDSIYPQIAAVLRSEIVSGQQVGALQGVKLLAKRFAVNFMTVDKALRQLESEGLVRRIHRKGTFVSRQRLIVLAMQNIGMLNNFAIYSALVALLQAELSRRSCALVYCNLTDGNRNHAAMVSARVDGVICIGPLELLPPSLRSLCTIKLLGEISADSVVDEFVTDNYRIGEIAAEYLASRGCTRIIYLGIARPPATVLRESGFMTRAAALGIECRSYHAKSMAQPMYEAVAEQLQRYEEDGFAANGFFAVNDQVAAIAVNHLLLRGKIPNRDVYVIGCNNSEPQLLPREYEPASIDLNLGEIAAAGIEHLFAKLDGNELPVQKKVFQPKLIVKDL